MAKFLVSIRLLGIVSTTVLKFCSLFSLKRRELMPKFPFPFRLLCMVSATVLKFFSLFSL